MIISRKQIALFDAEYSEKYLEQFVQRLRSGFPDLVKLCKNTLVPDTSLILHHSKKWNVRLEDDLIRLAYLLHSYESGELEKPDQEIVKLMTWPGRAVEDKLTYLHDFLLNKHYGTIGRGE